MKNRGWIVLLLSVVVYGANFWGTSIYILDEAKNSGCAMEMLQRGDWVVPTFNSELRTDKPPLHYFFMKVAYQLFGINPFSARLFSVISGVLLVFLIYSFLKRNFNEPIAFIAAILLISSLQLAIQFHLAVPDPYLILFLTASILFFYEGYVLNSKFKLSFFYLSVSLAFISKGLIALAFPGMIVLLFLLARKEFTIGVIKKLNLPVGFLIFLLIGVPWYAVVGIQTNGVWLQGFFLEHNVSRFTSTMEGHKGFFLAPFVILILGTLPFSFAVFPAIRFSWRNRIGNPFILLCLIAVMVIPGFFSFSRTLLPSYPAPAIPFLAILLSFYWNEQFIKATRINWKVLVPLFVYLLITLAIPIGVYIAMVAEFKSYHFQNLAFYFVLLPAGAIAALILVKNRRKQLLPVLSGSWIITVLIFFYVCFPQIDKINPVTQSLPLLANHKIAYYGDFNPAYVMALHATVKQLETKQELVEFLKTEGRVITQQKYLDEIEPLDFRILFIQKDIFENPITVIIEKKLSPRGLNCSALFK